MTFNKPAEFVMIYPEPLAGSSEEACDYLQTLTPEQACEIGLRARSRVLGAHTAAHRAAELEHEPVVSGLLIDADRGQVDGVWRPPAQVRTFERR